MILVRNPPMCFAHSATMMLLGRLVMRTSACSRRRWPISLGRLARIFGRLLRNSRLGIIRSVRQGSFIRLDSNPAVEPAPSSIRRTELGTSRSSMPRLAASKTSTSQPRPASPAARVSIVRSVPPIGSDWSRIASFGRGRSAELTGPVTAQEGAEGDVVPRGRVSCIAGCRGKLVNCQHPPSRCRSASPSMPLGWPSRACGWHSRRTEQPAVSTFLIRASHHPTNFE